MDFIIHHWMNSRLSPNTIFLPVIAAANGQLKRISMFSTYNIDFRKPTEHVASYHWTIEPAGEKKWYQANCIVELRNKRQNTAIYRSAQWIQVNTNNLANNNYLHSKV